MRPAVQDQRNLPPVRREAVEAYAAGDWGALHDALRLTLDHVSPLDVCGPTPPPEKAKFACWRSGWAKAWLLRQSLHDGAVRARLIEGPAH